MKTKSILPDFFFRLKLKIFRKNVKLNLCYFPIAWRGGGGIFKNLNFFMAPLSFGRPWGGEQSPERVRGGRSQCQCHTGKFIKQFIPFQLQTILLRLDS